MEEKEKKIDFSIVDEFLGWFEQSSIKSKDYIKFVIGLSTGTLILSATLTKDLFKTPQYNFILIIGWCLLFISIVVGVWILPVRDNLQSWVRWMKRDLANPAESTLFSTRKPGGHTLINWMKELTHPYIREHEKIQNAFKSWENYLSTREPKRKDLKKLKNLIETLGIMGVKEEAKQVIKDGIAEIFKLYPFAKSFEKQASLPGYIRKIRWGLWQMTYLEQVMKYSFFVGMLAILVFAIINFIQV